MDRRFMFMEKMSSGENGGNLLGVCKWTEDLCLWKKCPQGVVCPRSWAIYMCMTIIFKHLLLENCLANQSKT